VRILYLGLPLGALHLGRAGFWPDLACIGHPDAAGMRRLRRVLGPRRALLLGRPDLDDPAVQETLAAARPDVLLSFFWPRRIPAAVLALPARGAFGTHPSLLPRWRGPDPYFWTIARGDVETGVTLHRLAGDYDTGPIVAQRTLAVPDGIDAWRLARRLDRPALQLLAECASRLARGEPLAGTPQDDALATWAPAPSAQELAIDWHRPAGEIVRLVRAAAPFPGATALLPEGLVRVVEARVAREPPPRALEPAEAWQTPEGLAVRAADLGVLLVRTEPLDDPLRSDQKA
jgi:methionyl-tRNA formyltransferase